MGGVHWLYFGLDWLKLAQKPTICSIFPHILTDDKMGIVGRMKTIFSLGSGKTQGEYA